MFGPSRSKSRREASKTINNANSTPTKSALKSWAKEKIINHLPHDNLEPKDAFNLFSPALSGIELEVVNKHEKTYRQPTISSAIRTGGKLPGKLPARSYVREKLPPKKIRKLILFNNEMPKHSKTYKLKRATRYVNEDDNYLVYLEQAASKRVGGGGKRDKRDAKTDNGKNYQQGKDEDEEYENAGPKRALYEHQLREEAYELSRKSRIPFSSSQVRAQVHSGDTQPRIPPPSSYPHYNAHHYQQQQQQSNYQRQSFSGSDAAPTSGNSRRDYDHQHQYGHPANVYNGHGYPPQNFYPPPQNYFQTAPPMPHLVPSQPPPQAVLYPPADFGYSHHQNNLPLLTSNGPFHLPISGYEYGSKLPRNDLPMTIQPSQPFPPYNPSNLIKSPASLFYPPQPVPHPPPPQPPPPGSFGYFNYDGSAYRKRQPSSSTAPVANGLYNPYVYNFQVAHSYPDPPGPVPPPRPPPPPKNRPVENSSRSYNENNKSYERDGNNSHLHQHQHPHRNGQRPPLPGNDDRKSRNNSHSSTGNRYTHDMLQYYRYDDSNQRGSSDNAKPLTGIVDPHTFSYRGHPVCEWKENDANANNSVDRRTKDKSHDQYYGSSILEAFTFSDNPQQRTMIRHGHVPGENPDDDVYGNATNHYDYNSNIPHIQPPPRDSKSYNGSNDTRK